MTINFKKLGIDIQKKSKNILKLQKNKKKI